MRMTWGSPGVRYLYRDSGKRYEFNIQNGVVVAKHSNGSTTSLTQAVSYTNKRSGQPLTAPTFDLIAASGGRIFAKEKDADRFYIATMDHVFIHVGISIKFFRPQYLFQAGSRIQPHGSKRQGPYRTSRRVLR